ncbi:hypothetical protein Cni_G29215 [Canna indica]|uniref:Uncharacterized protein n=1 Tax=Canna indica TaxID=4628 RepID=A0AAQ3L4Y3_9LILI|nr:hypothetical protein Cni_G29215 [Canna indica]
MQRGGGPLSFSPSATPTNAHLPYPSTTHSQTGLFAALSCAIDTSPLPLGFPHSRFLTAAMPGTIQISVLEFVEPPPSALLTHTDDKASFFLSLKVTTGKREYQTMGKRELSFPVVSLRDNLVVMVYGSDGNLVSQTAEFKTISVVEKGTLDGSFSLEGGGIVHLRLQFILSEEERLRVHELRNSKLKRNDGDLLKEELQNFSGNKFRDTLPTYIAKFKIQGSEISQSKHADQVNTQSSVQNADKHSQDSLDNEILKLSEIVKGKGKIISPTGSFQERDSALQESSDVQREHATSIKSENAMEETIPSSKPEDRRSERNSFARSTRKNVRTMISAFEITPSQGPENIVGSSASLVSKNQTEGSLKRISSEESIEKKLFRQNMAKSFSAGTLFDTNPQNNSKLPTPYLARKQEGKQQSYHATNTAAMVNKSKFLDQKVKNIGPEHIGVKKVPKYSSLATNNSKENSELRVSSAPQEPFGAANVREQKDKSPLEFKKIHNFGRIASSQNYDEMQLSRIEEKLNARCVGRGPTIEQKPRMDKEDSCYITNDQNIGSAVNLAHKHESHHEAAGFLGGTKQSRSMTSEPLSADEPCSTGTHQQVFYCGFCRGHSKEQLCSWNLFESTELLYSQTEEYVFDTLCIWVPRHLCVTTGSKQLRNLLGSCRKCLQSLTTEKKFTLETNEKEKIFSDSSVTLTKSEISSHSPGQTDDEDILGSSSLKGKLIDQGVRIIIVIVACGTLLLSTR